MRWFRRTLTTPLTWRGVALDGLLAAVLLTIGLTGTEGAGENQDIVVDARAYIWVVPAAIVIVVRRIWPLATLAVVAVASGVYLAQGYPYGPILASLFVAVYTVATRYPPRRAGLACALASVVVLLNTVTGARLDLAGVVPQSAWIVVPFAVGVTVRLTREAAERTRQEQARRVADEERLRIAQEVHDVVGHGLAAINMQAEIALHVLPKRPEQAATALAAISRSSKEALDELRVTLALVRRGGEPADDRAPTPGLAQVEALRTRMASVGLPVTVTVTGARRSLPSAVDLAAYRLVQEALTNVLRHAGNATATVHIGYTVDGVDIAVTDTGRGGAPDATAGGHGLAGMRERVTALGGDVHAGPRSGGGFEVRAHLPLEPVA